MDETARLVIEGKLQEGGTNNFIDPWGNSYRYTKLGQYSCDIYSQGFDKLSDTVADKLDDIRVGKGS